MRDWQTHDHALNLRRLSATGFSGTVPLARAARVGAVADRVHAHV